MSTPRHHSGETAVGRPRDPQLDDAILRAALAVLDETGYAKLSLEEVARRAGTTRPAIYRRWPGRVPLVLAAIAMRLAVPTPPDTGCTLCDLGEGLNVFLAAYRTIRPDVLIALYADCATDPELRGRYMATVVEPPRGAVGCTIDRAIGRGDLRPDVDREMLLDMISSLVHYRALFGRLHLTDSEAEEAIETLLRGAAVDYDALVEHSEALELEHTSPGGSHAPTS
ncbi:TetR/AcrR family transcriptional regulator [Hoyosella subflava]|uniref:Transcriptional regulator n=1 Tax=Hoyosella subflava (strain DSM 45089 / JCM 17490 / NBRC 109087 / DQS3-9A1) TaxID=443218 RepID=F6EKI8_HOYSD|nr:TetR/AcrR family transcriptional regulator [Hoyosella subflava]AEF39159.1 Transcriptional regulator [Hoyosella subflava DQS3-9A1]